MEKMDRNNPILAIDPGNIESGYAVIDFSDKFKLLDFGKINNEELIDRIPNILRNYNIEDAAIEMVASYGMAVGREIFETCVWIGRFVERLAAFSIKYTYIYRIEEKEAICHDSRAKDTNIRVALIDRYAQHDLKNGKGTKKNPDIFYGVAKDVWAAIAIGVTYNELYMKKADNAYRV